MPCVALRVDLKSSLGHHFQKVYHDGHIRFEAGHVYHVNQIIGSWCFGCAITCEAYSSGSWFYYLFPFSEDAWSFKYDPQPSRIRGYIRPLNYLKLSNANQGFDLYRHSKVENFRLAEDLRLDCFTYFLLSRMDEFPRVNFQMWFVLKSQWKFPASSFILFGARVLFRFAGLPTSKQRRQNN